MLYVGNHDNKSSFPVKMP